MFLFALLACGAEDPAAAPEKPVEHATRTDAPAEGHAAHASASGWDHYGKPFAKEEAADCTALIADPASSVDQVVRVTGRIENVCQKAGCWMVIADDDGKYLRVTMKDHAFGVPTSTSTGPETMVDVEGTLVAKTLDEKTLAHLKSEAKGTDAEKAAQFAPEYEIVATAVAVRKGT
jgi:hypothetical protein